MSQSIFDQGPGAPVDWTSGVIPGTTQNADPNAPGVAGSTGTLAGTGTGLSGVLPVAGPQGGGMGGAINEAWTLLNQPFTSPYSTLEIVALVGIVGAAIIFWSLILYHIRIAAEAI
jgi:hypothetical protein